jgi:hypothetical protein
MNICENCGVNHEGNYGSGRFCNDKCAKSFSTKQKRKEINEKVSNTLLIKNTKDVRVCEFCGNELPRNKRKKTKTCSRTCGSKLKWVNLEYRTHMTKTTKERCSSEEEKIRLRDIGRMGGFGKKGYTKNNVYYESSMEKRCFEFLDDEKINYEPHKPIPNSSKVSDIFLVDFNLWVELDGINREKRKKWLKENYDYWLEKLKIYESEKLNYKIFYNFNDFKEYIKKSIIFVETKAPMA